jgi:hypothetical protein
MARLIFFDDTHTYTVDGEEYPSVSEISRFASREIYGEVNQFNLDNACNRGSAVHKATEILDKYGSVECAEDIENYIRAYVSFRKDFGVKDYAFIEKPLANEKDKYAGTIDRIYTIDEKFINSAKDLCCETIIIGENGKVEKRKGEVDLSLAMNSFAIIDIKSSSVVQNVLALIQLNAYKESVEVNELGIVGALFILHLEKDGNYKLINVEINSELFKACLTLHNALKKKKRIKK